jgi:CRISPR-associated protein (TIGR02584 family)
LDREPPVDPHCYRRRILLVVTGLTPQVVTETVYALAVAADPPWLPTAVHLLTTRDGAERARLTLLSEEPGWFHRLCRDYRLTGITFGAAAIHTVGAGDGLADIQTPEDNRVAADAITEQVRALTADPEAALHVSLAGGRKTLGFYAGYALSLFGRPQDRLSHVLVSPPFESHPEFYYPTPGPHVIYTLDADKRPIDTREAQVTLAEIPFVRLRHGLPAGLLAGRATFSETVAAAQLALGPPELMIDLAGRRVVAGGQEVALAPAELAFLAWLARRRMAGEEPLPCPNDGAPEAEYAAAFLAEYRRILGPLGDADRTERALRPGMDKGYFLQRRARLTRLLRDALGPAAAPYLVAALGRRPATRYGVTLEPVAIRCAGFTADSAE